MNVDFRKDSRNRKYMVGMGEVKLSKIQWSVILVLDCYSTSP